MSKLDSYCPEAPPRPIRLRDVIPLSSNQHGVFFCKSRLLRPIRLHYVMRKSRLLRPIRLQYVMRKSRLLRPIRLHYVMRKSRLLRPIRLHYVIPVMRVMMLAVDQ
ncbi:Hypothetical predicted protein [Scomber scombrus]|uniref:Uncharacterized protein n=1 Tax=Scomber scombrus TaxID=13677 RepID=A0AAV1NJI7_SCOSC